MITKELFIRTMKRLKEEDEFVNSLRDLLHKHRNIVGDNDFYGLSLQDDVVRLLEDALDLTEDGFGYTTLAWYIYEADFGENKDQCEAYELTNLPDDHKYRFPFKNTIKDFEDLYEYLIWEVKYDKGEIKE